jgi:branched-subunit amino acid aminotransferase/4-amino-4-deoxychorismate lyase
MHHTPLMCDDGHILSTPTANVLVYRQGQWWTPAGDGVLPGIVRGALLDSGVVLDAHCPVDWLEECEALALCNSGYFILPVTRVHERDLPESGSAFELLYRVLSGRPGVPAELPCSE